MITLHRLNGDRFLLNCDMIERADAKPDTTITMLDGKKYIVTETLDQVLDAVRDYHSSVLAAGLCGSTDLTDAAHNAAAETADGADPGRASRRHLRPVQADADGADSAAGLNDRDGAATTTTAEGGHPADAAKDAATATRKDRP